MVVNFAEVVFLDPGEYEITPATWRHNNYTHHLTVHDNDTGTYRMRPVYEDSAALDSHHMKEGLIPGGRTSRIPQDGRIVVVASPTEGVQAIQVYEVIAHL
jgi:hypothetical protein